MVMVRKFGQITDSWRRRTNKPKLPLNRKTKIKPQTQDMLCFADFSDGRHGWYWKLDTNEQIMCSRIQLFVKKHQHITNVSLSDIQNHRLLYFTPFLSTKSTKVIANFCLHFTGKQMKNKKMWYVCIYTYTNISNKARFRIKG